MRLANDRRRLPLPLGHWPHLQSSKKLQNRRRRLQRLHRSRRRRESLSSPAGASSLPHSADTFLLHSRANDTQKRTIRPHNHRLSVPVWKTILKLHRKHQHNRSIHRHVTTPFLLPRIQRLQRHFLLLRKLRKLPTIHSCQTHPRSKQIHHHGHQGMSHNSAVYSVYHKTHRKRVRIHRAEHHKPCVEPPNCAPPAMLDMPHQISAPRTLRASQSRR